MRVALQWLVVALVPWLVVPAKLRVESRPIGVAMIGASDVIPAIPAARDTHRALRDAPGKSREPRQFGTADVESPSAMADGSATRCDCHVSAATARIVHWVDTRAYHTTGPPQALPVV